MPDSTTWNSPRSLGLVAAARRARHGTSADSAMRSYRADARGFVYFFIDRPDEAERTLVKADQIALEIFWRAPGDAKQRIVGLRDRKLLPTNIRYHLDHLTVVQDEFGDVIRIGDGDEVAAVMHPAAPRSDTYYDFRLTDSLTISFASGREPVRVYQLQVRPRDLDLPGIVGSMFLDRATGAIVRMNFTFTPSSYVDPQLDYIRISLDNGLWLDRFWLPYRQEVELRRELPVLDFLAGSVIRGRFEIGGYEFNTPLPDDLFQTRGVAAVPEEERRSFPFVEPLLADLETEGLAPSPSLEAIEAQVRALAVGRALSGLRRFRLYLPAVSEGIRYDRAEGLFAGMGLVLRPGANRTLRLHAGWAFARGAGSARVDILDGDPRPHSGIRAGVNRLEDIGPISTASGVLNSLATLGGEDYTDPYFASGVNAFHRLGAETGFSAELTLTLERHTGASRMIGDDLTGSRPVRSIEEGWLRAVDVGGRWATPDQNTVITSTARVARLNGRSFASGRLSLTWRREEAYRRIETELDLHLGFVTRLAPAQSLFLLGGRETLPGYAYRERFGNRFWLLRVRAGAPVSAPWIGAHVFAALGDAWLGGGASAPPDWAGSDRQHVRVSAGLGLDLFWNVVRVDLGRGLDRRGDWEFALAVTPRFRSWL